MYEKPHPTFAWFPLLLTFLLSPPNLVDISRNNKRTLFVPFRITSFRRPNVGRHAFLIFIIEIQHECSRKNPGISG